MLKYCPTCERSSKEIRFIGEFCEACIIKKLAKRLPNTIKVSYCKRCERLKAPGGYVEFDNKALASVITHDVCERNSTAKVKSFDGDVTVVDFIYNVEGEQVHVEMKEGIEKKHLICRDCYRKSSGYYEALVQLRGDRIRMENMVTKIKNFLASNSAFITKIEELDEGLDVYVSDKKAMNAFFLYSRINPKRSYTLYGIKEGREVYRNIYALRL